MDPNKQWMSRGNIGCTFASYFSRNPQSINWVTLVDPVSFYIPDNCSILSLQFPGSDIHKVKQWALDNGFYLEDIDDKHEGLRLNVPDGIAWVQYLGPDSHAKTRQCPIPELIMCVKLPAISYVKVGFKGVLHLAHASVNALTQKMCDILWKTSFENTERKLGHSPTIHEAAKTTYIK